jgi:hypothetical protein
VKARKPGGLAAIVVAGFMGFMNGACGHARTVQKPEEGADTAAKADAGATTVRHAQQPKLAQGGVKTSNGIELTTSSAGQLKTGAARLIQQRLARAGVLAGDHETGDLDAETLAALTRFQEKHALPATGEPDRATVNQLGLAADAVFKVGAGP